MQTPHGLPPSPSRSSSASGPRPGLPAPVAARRFRSIERKLIAPLALVFGAVALGVAWATSQVYSGFSGRAIAEEARIAVHAIVEAEVDTPMELDRFLAGMDVGRKLSLATVVVGDPPRVVASTRREWEGLLVSELPSDGRGQADELRRALSERGAPPRKIGGGGRVEYVAEFAGDGVAVVHLDAGIVEAEMFEAAAWIVVISVLGLGVFAFMTAAILRRRVVRRLSALSRSSGLELAGSAGREGESTDDEIALLADAIASSREREQQDFAEIERLALVARNTTNAVIITDTERRIVWVNEGFTRITGYRLEEVVGLVPGHVLQSGSTSRAAVERIRGALERCEPCRAEILNRSKDGREYWIDIEIQPVRDKAGALTGFMAVESDVTAAVRAREEIAESDRKHKLIVTCADLGTWEWNLGAGTVSFNERWCGMLGFEPGEIEPSVRGWESLLHPDDRVRVMGVLNDHLAGKTDFYRCEHRLRRRHGGFVWVLDAGKVYERDAAGKPLRMSGVHIDVTERRRAEERFELAVRGSSAGIWDWDVKTDANFMSARFKEMLGFPSDEPMDTYDGWARLLHPDDRATVEAALQGHLRGEGPYSVDYRLMHCSGQYRWYHAHGQAVWDIDGKPLRMAGSLEDIHDRRMLELQRDSLAAIVGGSEDSILGVSLDGNISSVNAAGVRMLGIARAALLGQCELTQVPDAFRVHEAEALARVARGERVEQYESRRARADGTAIEVSVSVSPVFDERGRVVAASKIVRDISERSEKRELEKLNALLARQNRKLEEMTARAHRFVDDVSHEFRTPLTVIREYSSIVAEGLGGPVSAQQAEWLRVIDVATVDLNQLVEDFLDSSKLRAGRLRVDRRPCSAESILAGVSRMIARKAASRSIEVRIQVEPGLPDVFADAEMVRRVLMNLVSNAIKFSPEKGAIELSANLLPTGDVRIAVHDQGPGISPADAEQLFERFKQLPNALAPGVKGFGLGLNIARQLVWLNLGVIRLERGAGQGATFSFTLPANRMDIVVERFFERIAEREEPSARIALLRVEPSAGGPGVKSLRRLAVAVTRPSDIVVATADGGALALFGPTDDTEEWRRRIVAGFECIPGAAPEVKVAGSWLYPQEIAVARIAIKDLVVGEVAHAG